MHLVNVVKGVLDRFGRRFCKKKSVIYVLIVLKLGQEHVLACCVINCPDIRAVSGFAPIQLRDGVTLYRRLSVAARKPRISSVIVLITCAFTPRFITKFPLGLRVISYYWCSTRKYILMAKFGD